MMLISVRNERDGNMGYYHDYGYLVRKALVL